MRRVFEILEPRLALDGNPLAIGVNPLILLTLTSTVILTIALARYVSGHRALLQLSLALGTWVALGSGFTAPFNFALLASGIQANRYQLILPLLAFAALNVRLAAVPE